MVPVPCRTMTMVRKMMLVVSGVEFKDNATKTKLSQGSKFLFCIKFRKTYPAFWVALYEVLFSFSLVLLLLPIVMCSDIWVSLT